METNPNPTAYGIRLEILKMAHNDCFQLFEQKLRALENSKPLIPGSEHNVARLAQVTDAEISALYPTTEQIMDRAKQLYKFVCEK